MATDFAYYIFRTKDKLMYGGYIMNNLEIVAVAVIPVCMVLMFVLSKRDIKSFKMNFTFPIKFNIEWDKKNTDGDDSDKTNERS